MTTPSSPTPRASPTTPTTPTTPTGVTGEIRLPPGRFYWGMLDGGALPRNPSRRETRLGYLFESVLPVPVESIHAVYAPLDSGRVVACGIDRGALSEHAGALVLGPDGPPDLFPEDVDPRSLNLLVGEFEPRAIRRARARLVSIVCAGVMLLALTIGWGQLRRAAAHAERARSLSDATAAVYDRVLPPSTSALPPAARLTAELRSLDRTRGEKKGIAGPTEIAPTLAAMLASWPSGLHVTTDAITASPTAITLAVRLPDEPAAERFERELRAPEGWRLSQPSVQRERDGITVRVRMEPGGGDGGGSGGGP